jgi:hypothetical protein
VHVSVSRKHKPVCWPLHVAVLARCNAGCEQARHPRASRASSCTHATPETSWRSPDSPRQRSALLCRSIWPSNRWPARSSRRRIPCYAQGPCARLRTNRVSKNASMRACVFARGMKQHACTHASSVLHDWMQAHVRRRVRAQARVFVVVCARVRVFVWVWVCARSCAGVDQGV